MLVNFAVAFAVARGFAAPPQHVQALVDDIRIPAGAGVAQHH